MYFPNISDIATTSIIYTTIDDSLSNAVTKMYNSNHRNIVVIDKNNNKYYIILPHDIVLLKSNKEDFTKRLDNFQLTPLPTIEKDKNILESITFLQNSIEYIGVLDKDNSLYGILTFTDIVSHIDPNTLMDSYKVGDMIKISKQVEQIPTDMQTHKALLLLAKNRLDSLIIMSDNNPVGIITTKDAVRLLKNSLDLSLPVVSHMTSPIKSIHEDDTIKDALDFLQKYHYRRVVVVDDNDELVGAITQKELITLTYSQWAMFMNDYHKELLEINQLLEDKSKKFEVAATYDNLTGLYTRNKFIELFLLQYQTMIKSNKPLSLFVIDFDNFKIINDTFGHNIGDQVLKSVTNIIHQLTRHIDVLARWGGDEFVLLTPTADIKTSEFIAKKFQSAIEDYTKEQEWEISVSIGITEVKQGDTLDDVINRADRAMYRSKKEGKNRVNTY